MALRPYQQQAVRTILAKRVAGISRQLITMPTGAGKTIVFASLPQYMGTGRRMLVLAHTDKLCEQAKEKIRDWNPSLSVGLEKAQSYATSEDVVVASVQTLGKDKSTRINKFVPDSFDWLVIDEAHHSTSASYKRIIDHFNPGQNGLCLVGVTATPNRSDQAALGSVFDAITFRYTIQQGIADGWLTPPTAYRVKTTTDISGVKSQAGDFALDQLSRAVNNPRRNALIVKEWLRLAKNRQTVCFCVDIQHSKDLARAFQEAGVKADFVYGADKEQSDKLTAYDTGDIDVLCNCQLLTEGWDHKNTSCVIMSRPTKSSTVFIQAVGRGLRLGEGIENLVEAQANGLIQVGMKVDCLVLDVCDVTLKQSLVTLPTLFGLPPKLNLKGCDVLKVATQVEEAQKQNPGLDFSHIKDTTELQSYLENVDLWQVRFAEELKESSKLQWRKQADGVYRLELSNADSLCIRASGDLYTVSGTVKGFEVDRDNLPSLEEAVEYADSEVGVYGRDYLALFRRVNPATSTGPTDKQLALLRRFHVPESTLAAISKSQAGMMIVSRLKGRN